MTATTDPTRATITVYSKPACVQCDATLRALEKRGIAYELVDLTADADALESVRAMGYQQVPVVVASPSEHWSGYRPERIAALASRSENATPLRPARVSVVGAPIGSPDRAASPTLA
ncbi:glutaredoxin-like protein NrdH [Sanguibacter hominis ATCC BAA-789]|uniref:Glutaredoxin-like protein NrdH n=1 Tax=Sanguibacter hominis ATCC BAA-789 TaxID=1312740 RepID=A0A9X5ISL3_9MICO|nr:glutaredoxin-like protein NrdH [Sanguibacter hominis ATCC BAA-789]